jgi:hypothetical protein
MQFPHCTLVARVWMPFEQRHIDAGREYYDEALEVESLHRDAEAKRDIELVRADDVSRAVWSIQIVTTHPRPTDVPQFLNAHVAGGEPRERPPKPSPPNVRDLPLRYHISGVGLDCQHIAKFLPALSSVAGLLLMMGARAPLSGADETLRDRCRWCYSSQAQACC